MLGCCLIWWARVGEGLAEGPGALLQQLCGGLSKAVGFRQRDSWSETLALELLIGHRGKETKSSQALFIFRDIILNH